jgi:hypothetical protein
MADVQISGVDEKFSHVKAERRRVYSDRASKHEQLLMRPLMWKAKITNMEGSWTLKFISCFMEIAMNLLQLDRKKYGTAKDHGHTYKFFFNHYFGNATSF